MWSHFKEAAGKWVGISHDALHVHVGLALFLLFAWLLRRRRWGVGAALAAVLALEIGNEISDGFDWVRWTGAPNFAEAGRDIASTMLWPVVLAIGLALWRRKAARVESPSRATVPDGLPPV